MEKQEMACVHSSWLHWASSVLMELKLCQGVFSKSWAEKYHQYEERGREKTAGPYQKLELQLAVVYILSLSVIWC